MEFYGDALLPNSKAKAVSLEYGSFRSHYSSIPGRLAELMGIVAPESRGSFFATPRRGPFILATTVTGSEGLLAKVYSCPELGLKGSHYRLDKEGRVTSLVRETGPTMIPEF